MCVVGVTVTVGAAAGALTVKLTVIVRATSPPVPLTVTVAVYVPAANPALGRTVKVLFAPTAILALVVRSKVNELALVPESAIVSAPVATVPLLAIVTVCAAG